MQNAAKPSHEKVGDNATSMLVVSYLNGIVRARYFHSNSYDEAAELYKKGASYVVLPHFIGTEQISSFIRKHGNNKKAYERYRVHHLLSLGKVASEG